MDNIDLSKLHIDISRYDYIKDEEDRIIVFSSAKDFVKTYSALKLRDYSNIIAYLDDFDKLVELVKSKHLALAIIIDPETFLKNLEADIITVIYGLDLGALFNQLRYFFIEGNTHIEYMIGDNCDDIILNNFKSCLDSYAFNTYLLSDKGDRGYYGLDTTVYKVDLKSFLYSLPIMNQEDARKEIEKLNNRDITILECSNCLKALSNAIEEVKDIVFKD